MSARNPAISVGRSEIAAGAVGSSEIADGAVGADEIDDDAIRGGEIADIRIVHVQVLADAAVTAGSGSWDATVFCVRP